MSLRPIILFSTILVLLIWSCESPTTSTENGSTSSRQNAAKEIKENVIATTAIVELKFGSLVVKVDTAIGGRLASIGYEGEQMIKSSRDVKNLQWGSTVWPSPQSDWDWPPPVSMDQGAYQIKTQESNMLLLESEPNAYLGLTVKKRYHLRDPRTIDITYQFFNEKDTTIKVGIWENTRVDYEGQISWATDTELKESTTNMTDVADETRLVLEGQTEKKKLFINSNKGWVAYQKNGVELKKTFPIIEKEKIAEGQAQIEIYIDPADNFAEIEEHGPYEELGPGGVATFRVRWSFKKMPNN